MPSAKSSGPSPAQKVDQLNAILRTELSAVETYKIALDNLEHPSKARTGLETCLQSHQQRVALLRAAVDQLGGAPTHDHAAWERVVQVVEGLADDIGDKPTVAALEEAEDQRLAELRTELGKVDASTRQLIEMQLLPKQIQTHHTMSELKKLLH
jgi:hypothetical protein